MYFRCQVYELGRLTKDRIYEGQVLMMPTSVGSIVPHVIILNDSSEWSAVPLQHFTLVTHNALVNALEYARDVLKRQPNCELALGELNAIAGGKAWETPS